MSPRMGSKSITKLLSSPGRVATILDWRKQTGSVLSLHLGVVSIDLAVMSHPSQQARIQPLPSIPTEFETRENQKILGPRVLRELSDVVRHWKVCGMVVSWPVQKEGWCGAACGKVLWALDQIARETDIVTKNRLVCLWDGHHFHLSEDEWGRIALYGSPRDVQKESYFASKEQYPDCGMAAAGIARDFLFHHWPHIIHNIDDFVSTRPADSTSKKRLSGRGKSQVVDPLWLDAYSTCALQARRSLL